MLLGMCCMPKTTARRYDCGFHETFCDAREMKATVQRIRKKQHADVTEGILRVGTSAWVWNLLKHPP